MISLLCPTRKRPELAMRMAQSALDTAKDKIEILFYFDRDDSTHEEMVLHCFYYNPQRAEMKSHERIIQGPREGVGKAWNVLAAAATGDILAMVTDDCVFYTQGWDEHMALKCQSGIAYPNDGLRSACTFPFMPRWWYEALGYFTPECFGFFYHDTWIGDIADRLGKLTYVPNVHVTHFKVMGDETGREARQRSRQFDDYRVWIETEPQRLADAQKLDEKFDWGLRKRA